MLAELDIRNFALIERQRVPLGSGLSILSGGTGAGKSLVVDALKFVLGARGSADVIRTGAEEASVEALFYVDSPAERARVAAAVPALLEDGAAWAGELVLSRSINRSGRSRAAVNGRLVPVGSLEELGSRLVEVCGQHDAQALFRAETQREILDLFAGLVPLRTEYGVAYQALRTAEERLRAIDGHRLSSQARLATVEFEVRELRALAPKRGEQGELEQELRRLESAAKVRGALRSGYSGIYEAESSVLGRLRGIAREIEPVRGVIPELERVLAQINEASAALEDAALACRDLRSSFRVDEERRQEVDERISALRRASVKHAVPADELPARLQELEHEQDVHVGAGEGEAAIRAQAAGHGAAVAKLGAELSKARAAAGLRLSREVTAELADLGMPGAALRVALAPDAGGPGPSGLDRVELLIRTNEGDPEKPLRKIASGGEAARVMLALRARLAGEGSVPTLVFDEVDANVGGRLGTTIGRKLAGLARRWQVLCVTHLPQVAAFGARHLAVSKQVDQGRTVTTVADLDRPARLTEMANMLRGEGATAATRAEVEDMLRAAEATSSEPALVAATPPARAEPLPPGEGTPARGRKPAAVKRARS